MSTEVPYSDWCLTTSVEALQELSTVQAKCRYIIIGLEVGDSGYEHYQGFIQLKTRMRMSGLKTLAPTTHFERRRGTVEEAITYCKKDGCWFDHGEPISQGSRTDIRAFIADAKEVDRATMYELHPDCMVRYGRAYDDIKRTFAEGAPGAKLYWLFGPSGTGKTTFVQERHPGYYKKDPTHGWWQGYNGQSTVLIDEITDQIPYATLLTLCDRGINRLQTKGGDTASQATRVYITSNDPPDRIYARDAARPDRWDALLRRTLFLRVERKSHGVSVMKEVKWQDRWVETGQEKEFDVQVINDGPQMCDLD